MPNYNEKSVVLPEYGGSFSFPTTFDFFDANEDRVAALREFIFILRYFKQKSLFAYPKLYEEVFYHLVYTNPSNKDQLWDAAGFPLPIPDETTSLTDYNDVLPVLRNPLRFDPCLSAPPKPNLIAEGVAIFAAFYSTRQLAFDTLYSREDYEQSLLRMEATSGEGGPIRDMFPRAGLIERTNIANAAISSKSIIYRALYYSLIQDSPTSDGFLPIDAASNARKREFNEMLDVKLSFGKYLNVTEPDLVRFGSDDSDTYFSEDSRGVLSKLLYESMAPTNLTYAGPSSKQYHFAASLPTPPIFKRQAFLTRVREVIQQSFTKIGGESLNFEVKCLWSVLFPGKPYPDCTILATGDGSNTYGIFNSPNLGVIFFQYHFDNPLDRVKKSTSLTLSRKPNSSLLLKTYGAQGKDFSDPRFGYLPSNLKVSYKERIDTFTGIRNVDVFYTVSIDRNDITLLNDASSKSNNVIIIPTSTPSTPITSASIYVINPTASVDTWGVKEIARWNSEYAESEILNDRTFSVTIQQDSGINQLTGSLPSYNPDDLSNDYDEVQSLICIVPDPNVFPLYVSASDLYRNDKFFISKERISTLFQSPTDREAIEQIINMLVSDTAPASLEVVTLHGKFAGKLDSSPKYGQSEVIPDPEFIPHGSSVKIETGGEDPPSYDPLRYSFASIDVDNTVCTAPVIKINIESFVSPRHSGLKDRLDSIDLAGHIYDYRNHPASVPTTHPPLPVSGDDPAITLSLPPATWDISDPDERRGKILNEDYTNGYLINNSGFDEDGTPWAVVNKLSYNQPLAMLRCLGLLEGMAYYIKNRARERFEVSAPSKYNLVQQN